MCTADLYAIHSSHATIVIASVLMFHSRGNLISYDIYSKHKYTLIQQSLYNMHKQMKALLCITLSGAAGV